MAWRLVILSIVRIYGMVLEYIERKMVLYRGIERDKWWL